MRYFFTLLVTACSLLGSVNAATNAVGDKKAYVHKDSIVLSKGKILIHTDKGMIQTDRLYADKKGFYILKSHMQKSNFVAKWYRCSCGKTFQTRSELREHKRRCPEGIPVTNP